MTATAQARAGSMTVAEQVMTGAVRAWQAHGEQVEVGVRPVNGHAYMRSLVAFNARRVEYVIETDDPDTWNLLVATKPVDNWQLCALVPLSLMGRAHEQLCGHGFELQGWWVQENGVAFGGVEIA